MILEQWIFFGYKVHLFKHNDFNEKDPYLNIFNDDHKYIIHRRVKTKNSANDDLIIIEFVFSILLHAKRIYMRVTANEVNCKTIIKNYYWRRKQFLFLNFLHYLRILHYIVYV